MTHQQASIPLPAVCRTCGTIFPTTLGVPQGGSNVQLRITGLTHGPCPNCMREGRLSTGDIPAEWIDLSRPDVIAALEAPRTADNMGRLVGVLSSASREDLRALRDALAGAQGRSAAEIADDVERAAPGLRDVASWFRDRQNLRDIALLVSVIVNILMLLLMMHPSAEGLSPQQLEQVIHAVAPGFQTTTQPTRPPGRNEPCYCGSGIKYKRCHGAPPAREAGP